MADGTASSYGEQPHILTALVSQLPDAASLEPEDHSSRRFGYFGDAERFAVVVPDGVEDVDWSLVHGLSERAGRRLLLLQPAGKAFSTLQRIPWLTAAARPDVWVHREGSVEKAPVVTRDETIERVRQWAVQKSAMEPTPGPEAELRKASTPLHLGPDRQGASALAEWATSHPQLDASHRQGERAWHCAGQKVLSLTVRGKDEVIIRSGIHDRKRSASPDLILHAQARLDPTELASLQASCLNGVQERLLGKYRKADEHWLQLVLRRHPSLVGVEAPALREVPAWRPAGAENTFGRSYLDLMGLDGHGDIRLVEATLAKSNDDMVLLQGLDYYAWATAYESAIKEKLSAPAKAQLRLHYVVGVAPGASQILPPRVYQCVEAIDSASVPFRFHLVRGWETLAPDEHVALHPQQWAKSRLPYAGRRPG